MLPPGEARSQGVVNSIPQYISYNLDWNQVGEKGIKGLSRGSWALKRIYLGKNVMTKTKTSWGRRDSPTSPKLNGGRSKKFSLVLKL